MGPATYSIFLKLFRRNTYHTALLLLGGSPAYLAQNPCLLGLESFSSGNTHGAFISPYYGYRVGNHEMVSGPLLQLQTGMMNGLKVRYSYNLSGRKLPKGIKLSYYYRPPDRAEL